MLIGHGKNGEIILKDRVHFTEIDLYGTTRAENLYFTRSIYGEFGFDSLMV